MLISLPRASSTLVMIVTPKHLLFTGSPPLSFFTPLFSTLIDFEAPLVCSFSCTTFEISLQMKRQGTHRSALKDAGT